MLSSFSTNFKVRCVDFNPDGTKIVIGTADGDVILYKFSDNFDKFDKLDMNRQRKAVITDVK
jgi:hypothetical protein